jgi:fructosamine-3-kinase
LLHGDLWSGNQGADSSGNPVIYDPACYYGDHEVDLAMMELFGSPGERFFAVYRERFPIDADYPLRRDLYNLYHLLNHANLFGGAYAAQSLRVIDRLLAQLH